MFKVTASVDNYIYSMAQMGGVDLGSSVYSFQFYVQGDGRREQHNEPHVHIMLHGNVRGVLMSLNPPFEPIRKNNEVTVPETVLKKARSELSENLGYWHFVWGLYTHQEDYVHEYEGNNRLIKYFCTKHDTENPTRPYGARYLKDHGIT